MKKSFTLIELIVVIVILGILGTISIEILHNTFQNYVKTKELNKLSFKTDLALNIIAAKLQNRIKNSVIAVECNASKPYTDASSCEYNGSVKNGIGNRTFISLNTFSEEKSSNYPVLEWLYVSKYSKRGMWNSSLRYVQPGWSGFVDLKKTNSAPSGDEYNITSPESNFSIVQLIDGNWSQSWGIKGYDDVFENNITVLVFSGSDGRGDFSDINNSYGYYDNNATRVFSITPISDMNLTVKAINASNSTTVYEGYYIVRGAMAVVPVYDSTSHDYNLTLKFNYFPWNGQMYMDGNSSLLATHVTQLKFKEEGGAMRIYLCITSPYVKLSDFNFTICKEKVVF